MRWEAPCHGDKRVITRFLFKPLKIEKQVRWLELVKIQQSYKGYTESWRNERFID